MALTLESLADLATALSAAGVPTSMDPSDVNTPGGWLSLENLVPATMGGGWRLETAVYLIVDEKDARRALADLAALLTTTLTVLRPDGPVVSQGVILPNGPTPLPALRVPVHLFESE